eukprot:COSAG02_NODE_2318_length_9145_cov_41.373867_4_plen_100_part_00
MCGVGHWISVVYRAFTSCVMNCALIYLHGSMSRCPSDRRCATPSRILATATVEQRHEGQKQLPKRPSNIASKGRLNVQSTPPDPLIDRHHSLADTIKGR